MASDADSITLAIQLVDAVARPMLDLVEQAVACSRQLIDLLDRLAHAPTREPYRRIRILLTWLSALDSGSAHTLARTR